MPLMHDWPRLLLCLSRAAYQVRRGYVIAYLHPESHGKRFIVRLIIEGKKLEILTPAPKLRFGNDMLVDIV